MASVGEPARGATTVYVREVARVDVGPQPRFGAVTRDGRGEAVSAAVIVLKGSNGREVVKRVQARLAEIESVLPAGVQIRPFYSQGEVVRRTTRTMFTNLTEGALLVIAILFLFLRNLRASLLTASVIPLSLLFAFLAMKRFGLTANLMSLGALDFGLIVDASVVMVENFVRRLAGAGSQSGAERQDVIRAAAFEVGRPIVFGIAIIVAVYIPIFALQGLEGRMFRPMAFTVCAAVLGSLLLALSHVPAVASYLFARGGGSSMEHDDPTWFIRLRTRYERPHEATEVMALHQADVYVVLNPKRQWRVGSLDELIVRMDSALSEIPGLVFEFSAPMRMRLDEVISGVRTELGVKVYGDSLPLLQGKADEIEGVVRSVRGAEDVSVGVSAGAMQLEVDLDRAAIARYGLNVADVREAIETGVGGMQATEVIDGRRRFPIVVRLAASFRSTPEAVEQTLIRTPAGGTVTLSQVARVRTVEGPEVINHEGGQRYVVVQSNVRGRDLGGFAAEVKTAVRQRVTFPPGYYVTYGGQFENQSRAARRLAIIVPLVLLAIAGLLYATFDTLRHAVLVMLTVPFALVGGIAALWLRGLHLNLSASVGFIALFGVAVLNGVVLVTYINQLRTGGRPLLDAVREGATIRLRPVLMTALVASVGFIPMAISTGAGAEVQRPLATVVIGGLVTSTLLTLLVLPTLYSWVETMAKRSAASPVST